MRNALYGESEALQRLAQKQTMVVYCNVAKVETTFYYFVFIGDFMYELYVLFSRFNR